MHRFFVDQNEIVSMGDTGFLDGSNAEHARVLRLKKGENIVLCDGAGNDYICTILNFGSRGTEYKIVSRECSEGEPSVYCRVFAAYPKGGKAEDIVQKSVELGASEICFFPSVRCVSKPESREAGRKVERLSRIAEEAAKQSRRGIKPHIFSVDTFKSAVEDAVKSELALFLYEEEDEMSIRVPLFELGSKVNSVSLMSGSEGGFTSDEAAYAKESGMTVVSLGRRILRCETAPLAALSAVMLCSGNF